VPEPIVGATEKINSPERDPVAPMVTVSDPAATPVPVLGIDGVLEAVIEPLTEPVAPAGPVVRTASVPTSMTTSRLARATARRNDDLPPTLNPLASRPS
jgi:hypothetical protein